MSALFGLFLLPITLAVPSMPFCVLQLLLLKYGKGQLIQNLPVYLSLLGIFGSIAYIANTNDFMVLAGLLFLVPSLLCLIGCGLGRLIWNYAQEHLY